jgi:hypothetical protein
MDPYGRLVPVQAPPVKAPASALDGDDRQAGEHATTEILTVASPLDIFVLKVPVRPS